MTTTDQALLEEFTLAVAKAGPKPSIWTANDKFGRAHCPLPGPADDPHDAKGVPRVYIWSSGGDVHAHCDKCLGTKDQLGAECDEARRRYTDQLKELVGWQHAAGAPREKHEVLRVHVYADRDGKHIVRKKKVKVGGDTQFWWDCAPNVAGGPGYFATAPKFTPTTAEKFLPANYPEVDHLYLALHWYGIERLALPEGEAGDPGFFGGQLRKPLHVTILEGEKDADTFNELMAAGGYDGLGTCLAHPRPGKLAAHHLPLLADAHVNVIPDADGAGKEQAENWARLLWDHVPWGVKIVPLPGLSGKPDDKDLSDWVAKRGGPSKAVAVELAELMTSTQGLMERPASTAELTTMLALIRAWCHARYAPAYRATDCSWIWSSTFGARLKLGAIHPDAAIIHQMEEASDAPRYAERSGGGVKRSALPTEFYKWVKVVWGELTMTLPDARPKEADLAEREREGFRGSLIVLLAQQVDAEFGRSPLSAQLHAYCQLAPGIFVKHKHWPLWGRIDGDRFLIGFNAELARMTPTKVPEIGTLSNTDLTRMVHDCGLAPEGDNRIRCDGRQFRVTLIDVRQLGPGVALSQDVGRGV